MLSRQRARAENRLDHDVEQLDREFLERYAEGSRQRRSYFAGQGQAMAERYEALVALLREKASGAPDSATLVAEQTAWSLSRSIPVVA